MPMRTLVLVFALAGCDVEGMDECETPHQEGPGLSGTASYLLGDGSRLDADLSEHGYVDTGTSVIEIHSRFTDAFSHERAFELRITGMAVGTFDLAGRAEVCLPRMTNGPDICSPVSGTIEVRAF